MPSERMKYVNFVGPMNQLDEFILQYILDRDIQLEHALSLKRSMKGLKPFIGENPFDPLMKTLESLNKVMQVTMVPCCRGELCKFCEEPIDIEATRKYLSGLEEEMNRLEADAEKLQAENEENRQILKQLLPIRGLQLDMNLLFDMEYMKIRFGKLPKESFQKTDLVLKGLNVIVVPFSTDDNDVWVSYSMPAVVEEKIDSIMSSLYFERVWIPGKVKGSPEEAIPVLEQEIRHLEEETVQLKKNRDELIAEKKAEFHKTYIKVAYMYQAFQVRKFAAHTTETFYIVGWMPEKACSELTGQLTGQRDITVQMEEPEMVRGLKPPTILKNNRFFKPFESIVRMYGIPAHNEIDPTPLIAITFIFMFGAMFGDVGQGALFFLAGLYMLFVRKSSFGWIVACIGTSSILFGFLYGSIFGNEHLLQAVWKPPMENINQLLVISIGYGAGIILLMMGINIINSIRAKDYGRLIFDKNGLAGLIFYGGVLTIVLLALVKNITVPAPITFVLVVVPLLMILFKERLEKFFLKRHTQEAGSFVEGFFEAFEAVLGFLSNTVSFVRVSAFALSHAGLALAVWTLYDMVGGIGKIVVIIFGNVLIIGLEGLIVGIQCLRLQYYEMFSRFFSGDGREFKPTRIS